MPTFYYKRRTRSASGNEGRISSRASLLLVFCRALTSEQPCLGGRHFSPRLTLHGAFGNCAFAARVQQKFPALADRTQQYANRQLCLQALLHTSQNSLPEGGPQRGGSETSLGGAAGQMMPLCPEMNTQSDKITTNTTFFIHTL